MRNIILYSYVASIIIFFSFCGDILAEKKKIYHDYYLMEDEGRKDMSIRYKVSNDAFVGRVPSPVIAYSIVKDSLLIAKRKVGTETKFYIVDLTLDNPYADESAYLRGIIDESVFDAWIKKNNIDVEFHMVVKK